MSLNPIQFGKHVVDQFGRYLRTTFPIADERLAAPVADERAPTSDVLRRTAWRAFCPARAP
jgi:hypothetical protein